MHPRPSRPPRGSSRHSKQRLLSGRPGARLLLALLLPAALATAAWAAGGGGFLLAAGARLDRIHVSAAEFAAFLLKVNPSAKTGSLSPKEPAVNLTWHQARAYCLAQGKRLPSAAEWKGACSAGRLAHLEGVWEWTGTNAADGGEGFKVLCGPGELCECTHAYDPTWRNAVKGFRCALPEPNVRAPDGEGPAGRRLALR